MYKKRIILTIAALLSIIHLHSQKIQLLYNLKPGLSYQTETTNSISFTQEIMGISYTTDTKISNLIKVEVNNNLSDSLYTLKGSYSKMEFSLNSPRMNLEMSSEIIDSINPMNTMMKALIGREFISKVSKKGEIVVIHGLNELIIQELRNINLSEEEKEEFRDNFLQSFGEKAIQDLFLQNSSFYSENFVSAGDSWYKSITINQYGIPMHVILDIKLKELSSDYAVIMAEGLISAIKNNANTSLNTGSTYQLEGTQVSEIKINLHTGLIENSITSQYIHGKVSMPDPDTSSVIDIPLLIKSKSTQRSR